MGAANTEYEEEIMLDIFVAALLSVADPTVVAQAPTTSGAAVSKQSGTVGQSKDYAGIHTNCQDVAGQIAVPAPGGGVTYDEGALYTSRSFGMFPEQLYKRWGKTPGAIQSSEWVAKVNLKITELEAPKHGKVIVKKIDHPLAEANNPFWDSYSFIPDKDYLGKDRVVYEIEAEGKRYKLVLNFWVVPVVTYPKGDVPYVPECQSQKFNDSAIDPDTSRGQTGYSLTEYLMGGLSHLVPSP